MGAIEELRHAIRRLTRRPGFAVASVLTICVGIGANVAVFRVVDGALLRPLPYVDANRLVVVWYAGSSGAVSPLSAGDIGALREATTTPFDLVGSLRAESVVLTGAGDPLWLQSESVDLAYFRALGPSFAIGVGFSSGDFMPGGPRAAVLSYQLWRSRFGADPTIVGQSVTFGDTLYIVRGVTSSAFTSLFSPAQVWTARHIDADDMNSHGPGDLFVVARLKSGLRVADVRRRLEGLLPLMGPHPQDLHLHLSAIGVRRQIVGDAESALLLVWAAALAVLMLASANLTNLMLVNQDDHLREFAVRGALGATGWQMAVPIAAEALLLTLSGGTAGLVIGSWASRALIAMAPSNLAPMLNRASLDWRMAVAAFALTGLSVLVPAALAVRRIKRTEISDVIRGVVRPSASAGMLRPSLIGVEIALCLIVLSSASLLERTFVKLLNVDVGFNPGGQVSTSIVLWPRYPQRGQWWPIYGHLLASLQRYPGVSYAAAASHLPLAGTSEMIPVQVEGERAPVDPMQGFVGFTASTDNYFRVLGMSLLQGRGFLPSDESGPPVAIVNELFAKAHWPAEHAIGKLVRIGFGASARSATVIGIVNNVRSTEVRVPPRPEVYVPLAQSPSAAIDLVLRLRSDLGTSSVLSLIRQQLHSIAPEIPIGPVETLKSMYLRSMTENRFLRSTMLFSGALAFILAAVGVYGVVSYEISRRQREFAIRLAIGATRRRVAVRMLSEVMSPVALGVAVGLVGSYLLQHLLRARLYGVNATDLASWCVALSLSVGTALITAFALAWLGTRETALSVLKSTLDPR